MTKRTNLAQLDAQLSARIVSRRMLHYSNAASAALDRPAYVRAASGITWFDGKLAIVQDDASFIALVDPASAHVTALPLGAKRGGVRQFDKSRGNKRDKLDLECCFTAAVAGTNTLFALGSGSNARRESIVRVQALAGGYDLQEYQARALYAALNACKDFSGSELNLEGATLRGDRLVLWQRGNGEKKKGLSPINATCEVDFEEFVHYLDDVEGSPVPTLHNVTEHDLGSIAGTNLTFTDASAAPHGNILFLASAEASPNVIDDGVVVGAAVGVLRTDGAVALCHLLSEAGDLCRDKVEGIVLDPVDSGRAWVVMDPDDHTQPAALLEVHLEGPFI